MVPRTNKSCSKDVQFILELKELVSMHLEKNLENEEPLTGDEVLIIKV